MVLLLNASEEVVNAINWKRAAKLLVSGRAKQPYGHEEYYTFRCGSKVVNIPTTLMLVNYVRIPYGVATINRRNLMKRDGCKCQYCSCRLNFENESIDHVIPRSRGGKHNWSNIVACCKGCNSKKADRTPSEAKMSLVKTPVPPTRELLVKETIRMNMRDSWKRWHSD